MLGRVGCGGNSLGPGAGVTAQGSTEPPFSAAPGYSCEGRSSRILKWLLLQIYSYFNLTPSAQRNAFI